MPRSRTSDSTGGNSQAHGGVLVSGDAVDGVNVAGSSSSSSSSAVEDDAPAASTGHAVDDIEKIDRDQVNSLIKLWRSGNAKDSERAHNALRMIAGKEGHEYQWNTIFLLRKFGNREDYDFSYNELKAIAGKEGSKLRWGAILELRKSPNREDRDFADDNLRTVAEKMDRGRFNALKKLKHSPTTVDRDFANYMLRIIAGKEGSAYQFEAILELRKSPNREDRDFADDNLRMAAEKMNEGLFHEASDILENSENKEDRDFAYQILSIIAEKEGHPDRWEAIDELWESADDKHHAFAYPFVRQFAEDERSEYYAEAITALFSYGTDEEGGAFVRPLVRALAEKEYDYLRESPGLKGGATYALWKSEDPSDHAFAARIYGKILEENDTHYAREHGNHALIHENPVLIVDIIELFKKSTRPGDKELLRPYRIKVASDQGFWGVWDQEALKLWSSQNVEEHAAAVEIYTQMMEDEDLDLSTDINSEIIKLFLSSNNSEERALGSQWMLQQNVSLTHILTLMNN
ncbi:MAG: hypothetical protein F9K49_04145 [Caedimonadaceae bacterium]|nr:MAG: hypothetical protein F9K49_04145 [Caedimonadaceae bacterium]